LRKYKCYTVVLSVSRYLVSGQIWTWVRVGSIHVVGWVGLGLVKLRLVNIFVEAA